MLQQRLLMSAAIVLVMAAPAFADTGNSRSKQKGPANTTTDGNITIDQTIILHDAKAGAVAIVNSNNMITNNAGLISNKAHKDALDVELTGGGAAAGLTSTGGITAEGVGANNVGIQVDATGFTGNVSLSNDSTSELIVDGTNPIGFNILGTLNGSITTAAPVTVTGNVATGRLCPTASSTAPSPTVARSAAVRLERQENLDDFGHGRAFSGSGGSLAESRQHRHDLCASITGKVTNDTAIGIATDAERASVDHWRTQARSALRCQDLEQERDLKPSSPFKTFRESDDDWERAGTITTSLNQLDNGGVPDGRR